MGVVGGREFDQGRRGDEGVDSLARVKERVLRTESMGRRLVDEHTGVKDFLGLIRTEWQVLNKRIPRGVSENYPDKLTVKEYRLLEEALNSQEGEELFADLRSRALEMKVDEEIEEHVRVSTEAVLPQEQEKG